MSARVKATSLAGGNLVRAVPDQKAMEEAWASQDLTVVVSTKLNRSHLFPGKKAYILPCLSRLERDEQASGPQSVTTEDSFSHISGSVGKRTPASKHLKSELAIVTSIAKAAVASNPKLKWDEWTPTTASSETSSRPRIQISSGLTTSVCSNRAAFIVAIRP